jgi:hypothetical protein
MVAWLNNPGRYEHDQDRAIVTSDCNEYFELIFHDAASQASAWNKKKAPDGAFLVLTAVIFFLPGSYLLQFLSLDKLAVQRRFFGTAATGH